MNTIWSDLSGTTHLVLIFCIGYCVGVVSPTLWRKVIEKFVGMTRAKAVEDAVGAEIDAVGKQVSGVIDNTLDKEKKAP